MRVERGKKIKILCTNKVYYEGEIISLDKIGVSIKMKENEKEIEVFFPWNNIISIIYNERKFIEKLD